MKNPCVYILTNQKNGTLYTGVTSDLVKRIWPHKNKVIDGFSKKHNISMLVYYEVHDTMESAITREKQIKGGSRMKKLNLIETMNPNWNDLYDENIS
jgi:putative endonuclease